MKRYGTPLIISNKPNNIPTSFLSNRQKIKSARCKAKVKNAWEDEGLRDPKDIAKYTKLSIATVYKYMNELKYRRPDKMRGWIW